MSGSLELNLGVLILVPSLSCCAILDKLFKLSVVSSVSGIIMESILSSCFEE